MKKNRIRKFVISLFLLFSSTVFADTLYVVKGGGISSNTFIVKYKNMKMAKTLKQESMKDNEYMLGNSGLYYKVNGELYLTSMFEVKFD